MKHFRLSLALAVLLAAVVAVSLGATRASAEKGNKGVVVRSGEQVEIALVLPSESALSGFKTGISNAVSMAVAMHPTVRGFPIKLNTVDASCVSSLGVAAVAAAIVEHVQNTAVLGSLCSAGLVEALPIYETAGVVTISGSATRDDLPTLAPTVFNRTYVADGSGGETWGLQVNALASVGAWNQYHSAFPPSEATSEFDVLHFDAATLLLDRLQQVSKVVNGNLVIDRKALAKAVRRTTDFPGVSCTITLDPMTGNRVNDSAALERCGEG